MPQSRAAIVLEPPDTGEALVNPGMGWTLHYYSNYIANYGSRLDPSDTLDDWPGLSTIYLRVPWSYLEPKEGEFNWSLFDTPAQRWIAKGKQIAIRVSCSESWIRYATPKWVHDAGAKAVIIATGSEVELAVKAQEISGLGFLGADIAIEAKELDNTNTMEDAMIGNRQSQRANESTISQRSALVMAKERT